MASSAYFSLIYGKRDKNGIIADGITEDEAKLFIRDAIAKDDANQTKVFIKCMTSDMNGNKNFYLREASERNKPNVAKMLIEIGANINTKDDNGWTPLHVAAYNNYRELAKILIEKGANVDVRHHEYGYTALHIAARNNCVEIADLLIKNGADITLKDFGYAKKTALEWAKSRRYEDVVDLLIKKAMELLPTEVFDQPTVFYNHPTFLDKPPTLVDMPQNVVNEPPTMVDNRSDVDLCKICMDAAIECVLLECSHMATCADCSNKLSECPICRQRIVRVVRFFKV